MLTLAAARKIAAAAEAETQSNDWPGVIAVVDEAGWPILVLRMDDAATLAGIELTPG